MAWKRAEGDWSGKSYNHCLAAFRSLTGYLTRLGWLSRDPMLDADRANVDDAPGARVAATAEIAALIDVALLRQSDGRSKGFRALYWAAMAYTGARYSEPGRWVWGDFDLDADVETLTWRPEIQKVARRVTLAIHPRLAELLRHWRADCPDGGDAAPVFQHRATRPAFKDDAARASINLDGFSPHSLRKHFETHLISEGVPSRLVDVLMRHSLGVQGAYYRPDLESQRAALYKIPDVWTQKKWESLTKSLPSADGCGNLETCTPMITTPLQPAEPGTERTTIGVQTDDAQGAGLSGLIAGNAGNRRLNPQIGVMRLLSGADSTALADVLEAQADQLNAVARLLRTEQGHGDH